MYNFKKYNNINNNLLQKNKIINKYINFNTIFHLILVSILLIIL